MEEPIKASLRRFEFLNDGFRQIDWLWMTDSEVQEYLESRGDVPILYRDGTSEEEELYDEAYNDGYMLATVEESNNSYNGVTFRLNSFTEDGMDTTKMFECAICGETKDFDTDVAMANGFYISIEKQDVLWHVCFDCTSLELEFDSVESEK